MSFATVTIIIDDDAGTQYARTWELCEDCAGSVGELVTEVFGEPATETLAHVPVYPGSQTATVNEPNG